MPFLSKKECHYIWKYFSLLTSHFPLNNFSHILCLLLIFISHFYWIPDHVTDILSVTSKNLLMPENNKSSLISDLYPHLEAVLFYFFFYSTTYWRYCLLSLKASLWKWFLVFTQYESFFFFLHVLWKALIESFYRENSVDFSFSWFILIQSPFWQNITVKMETEKKKKAFFAIIKQSFELSLTSLNETKRSIEWQSRVVQETSTVFWKNKSED